MSELQQKINSENKAAKKALRDDEKARWAAEFASKVEDLKRKIYEKINEKKEERAQKAQLQELKEKADEEYKAFLELYDPSKEGTIEVFEKEGAKITIVHTKNGPLIEIVKEPVEIPPAEEPKTTSSKQLSQISGARLARGCYDLNVTYKGFFPKENKKGVIEFIYGNINGTLCKGIGDYGPDGDYYDFGALKYSGSVRENSLLGGKFEIIQEYRDDRGALTPKNNDVFKILESSFNEAKKEALENQKNKAESEGAGPAME